MARSIAARQRLFVRSLRFPSFWTSLFSLLSFFCILNLFLGALISSIDRRSSILNHARSTTSTTGFWLIKNVAKRFSTIVSGTNSQLKSSPSPCKPLEKILRRISSPLATNSSTCRVPFPRMGSPQASPLHCSRSLLLATLPLCTWRTARAKGLHWLEDNLSLRINDVPKIRGGSERGIRTGQWRVCTEGAGQAER